MTFTCLRYAVRERVATLAIHRPKVKNAIDRKTMEEMGVAAELAGRDRDLRALILTGSGEAFISGGDLRYFQSLSTDRQVREMLSMMGRVLMRIERLPVPTIAAVNGYAIGGGTEVALACDIRVAATGASFMFRQVDVGLITAWGGGQRLQRLVGPARASRLLLLGETVSAQEALALGLVDRVVAPSKLMSVTRDLARRIAAKPPLAIRAMKRALVQGRNVPFQRGLALEEKLFRSLWKSKDHEEAVAAFLEKRRPRFTGR
ncbi:MAG: enoyl-CoA hydratase/isomerase family protein [Candidatus Methylomirabilis oxyfera]|nr:enoyl-CoA hydratase/isomerase family protein [Candidatus Methylomirabilis oxyfera]